MRKSTARTLRVCTLAALAAAGPGLAAPIAPEPATALAYIDPGTGSVLVQALVAAVAGVAVTTRLYWQRIKAFLGRSGGADDGRDAPAQDE